MHIYIKIAQKVQEQLHDFKTKSKTDFKSKSRKDFKSKSKTDQKNNVPALINM